MLDVFDSDLTLQASYEAQMPVLVAPLSEGRFLVDGKGPDGQFWIGAVRLTMP